MDNSLRVQQLEFGLQIEEKFHFFKSQMQADYDILPKRKGKSDGSFAKVPKCKFFTNYFEVSLDPAKQKIYQYSCALPEHIPHDSVLYSKAMNSVKKFLKEEFGYLAHKGQMFWGTKNCPIASTKKIIFRIQQTEYNLELLIRQTKELNLSDLEIEETRPQLLQLLNIDLKNSLKEANMTELGKVGQFYAKNQLSEVHPGLHEVGLTILRGFKFTLVPLNSGISLQIDVCSRLLQSNNLFKVFKEAADNQPVRIQQMFKGSTVITTYGRYRTYTIEEIDYEKTPETTFHNKKIGQKMSYVDYYHKAYGLKTKELKQPLLKVIGKWVQETKNGKMSRYPEYIYLIPEFLAATGLTPQQRANHKVMKNIAPYTKLSPDERVQACEDIIGQLNKHQGIIRIKSPKYVDGFRLDRPDLMYQMRVRPDDKGNVKYRGHLKQCTKFTDWIFAYSYGSNYDRDDREAEEGVRVLTKAAQTYGIAIEDPGYIVLKGDLQKWKEAIKKDVAQSGAPQIIVFYLNSFEEKFYGEMKRFATNQLHCPSQFIRRKTLNNSRGSMSAGSKLVIQMNVKVGATPWEIKKRHPYFKGKNVMYGALSISKGKNGYTLAFVGTINDDSTKVFSDVKMGIKKKEEIPLKMLEGIFVEWAKSFFQTNGRTVPDVIILYREGLSDHQAKQQIASTEIPALEGMIKIISEKTNTKRYKPEVVCVIVNKKINSRYYSVGSEKVPAHRTPALFNTDSGSVVLDPLSVNNSYDFHLVSQYVTQGTCTPTLFKIAYDNSKIPQEALINFSFEQCFNYYNWEGAVRVPACLQCADKLSKLFGESIKEELVQSALSRKHFFL